MTYPREYGTCLILSIWDLPNKLRQLARNKPLNLTAPLSVISGVALFRKFLGRGAAWVLGRDVLPKEIMRAAAQLRYFVERLRDKSAFDVNSGLEYLHDLVKRWAEKGGEYAHLAEWITIRRGGRGTRSALDPPMYLLLCEIAAYEAIKKISERLKVRPFTAAQGPAALTDELGFLAYANGQPSLHLGRLNLGSKLFPVNLWDANRVENLYVDHPESDNGIELVWVPSALPPDLFPKLLGEIEVRLSSAKTDVSDSTSFAQDNPVTKNLRETYQRLTDEGSNAYPRLAGRPLIVAEDHHSTLQVPIGPSRYGVALIREKNLGLPAAEALGSRYILNSLAVRVAYVYEDLAHRKWVEFQQRQERENATYSGSWDVSAAGYIDPQRHEDTKIPGRVSPWRACASELSEELQIRTSLLPHRDNYYFFGVGRNDPTGQLDLLAYCLAKHVPDPKRAPSPLVKGYDRCVLEPEALAAFVLQKRRWVPTALLTLVLTLEACGPYTRRRIEQAFAPCVDALDLSP